MTKILAIFFVVSLVFTSCLNKQKAVEKLPDYHKYMVYQVFTRLFGDTVTTNKPWGTIEENGVGKFNDFTDKALEEIRGLGVTHIWYTGVLHHDVITDYSAYGISLDDPDVVKGRAGSPYAVKDYYNVDPDLAVDPARRMDEFLALIQRTHNHGLKVIIDLVPNHVARNYHSISKPAGISDFGEDDDTTVVYARNNNFYYIPGEKFQVPDNKDYVKPLGGEPNPLVDGKFEESPAKWTGNGTREAKPKSWDWYETVKINFGVQPDGSYDFDTLPASYSAKGYKEHFAFWQNKSVPDSWVKFRDIVLFWLDKGVDGFRYDMAELVPVEFWSYLNSAIKMKKSDAFLMAEVYNPARYRNYIKLGKMDYLYDKVEFYDTLRHIIVGTGSTDNLMKVQDHVSDIEHHMLHFLENHDEQRLASSGFAEKAEKGRPAMVVSACISTSPTMIYFGQELGEPAKGNPGFGSETRTTIFDYWGVPTQQRWMNHGKFDGALLSDNEKALRTFYKTLLNFTLNSEALTGYFKDIHSYNRQNTDNYNDKLFSFVRWKGNDKIVVVCSFDEHLSYVFDLALDPELIHTWRLRRGKYELVDQLTKNKSFVLNVAKKKATARIEIRPLQSFILKLENK